MKKTLKQSLVILLALGIIFSTPIYIQAQESPDAAEETSTEENAVDETNNVKETSLSDVLNEEEAPDNTPISAMDVFVMLAVPTLFIVIAYLLIKKLQL